MSDALTIASGTPADRYAPFIRADGEGLVELNLAVDNMHCAGCMARIEAALRDQPGVAQARVNLTTRRLALRFDPARTQAADLARRVEALGYRVAPYDPSNVGRRGQAESQRLLFSLAVTGFAAGNVMLLSVAVWAGSDMDAVTRDLFHWVSALIALPAVAYAGQPFYRSAFAAIRAGGLNMDVPISLAVILAAAMSLYETMTGGAHAYFDAAVMLLFFLLIGRYLDHRARGQANKAAEQLLLLGALQAQVISVDGTHASVPVAEVGPGMRVWVAPGDRVPVDGVIAKGRSDLDASAVTGESLPVAAGTGDAVFAGTLNLAAALEIDVGAAGENTMLAEIVRLMEAAQQNRARFVRLAERVARVYAPAVHLVALVTFLGWLLLTDVSWQSALLTAVAVLIITCPCALGLAVPAVQVVASGRLFRRGVLLKSGDGLERLRQVDTVVFDKTGTLTLGEPELADADRHPPGILQLAAGIAANSRHPLSQALVRAGGSVTALGDVREVAGMGLEADIAGKTVRLGNRRWCDVDNATTANDSVSSELWLAQPGQPSHHFQFQDRVRDDAEHVISRLRNCGFEIVLLSGDREAAVEPLAAMLGIERYQAEQTPVDKVAQLEALARAGHRVLMVGDGLNDAPALAAAHVSISPSGAADVSRTAADLIFQGEALLPVLLAIDTALATDRLVKQNLAIALIYNIVAVPLAIAGLVTPLLAAAAMSLSSLAVTGNALRLRAIRSRS